MYWVYRNRIFTWRNQYVQAKLVSPPADSLVTLYGKYGYRGGLQDEPYGADLELTFQVDTRHPHPDNHFQSASFTLFSKRLVELMQSYGVKAEIFPVTIVDKQGKLLPDLCYYVFHCLEGVLPAMDEERSGWTGDPDVGIPHLVLKDDGFEHRPMFRCNHIYVPLMRDDLKLEIRRRGITGFAFLSPERYRSGSYGFPPDFDE